MKAPASLVLLLTVVGLGALLPANAFAAVASPIPIPATVNAKAKGAHFQIKRGNKLTINLDNSKGGKKLRKRFAGKQLIVECYGMDAANTTAYDLIGIVQWGKKATKLSATLKHKIVPATCQIGLTVGAGPSVFFGIYDLLPDTTAPGDAEYAPRWLPLEDVVVHLYSALSRLGSKGTPNPTPQQLIDEQATDTTWTPSLPLFALAGETAVTDAAQIGVWTDIDEIRANQTAADGSTAQWVLKSPGMS